MESFLNISLKGVIGCNLLMPLKIKIDFYNNEIILLSTQDLMGDKMDFVAFEMQDRVPVCSVIIGGHEYFWL
jgi:hypothetical protein